MDREPMNRRELSLAPGFSRVIAVEPRRKPLQWLRAIARKTVETVFVLSPPGTPG
jgi:hypothetical protein